MPNGAEEPPSAKPFITYDLHGNTGDSYAEMRAEWCLGSRLCLGISRRQCRSKLKRVRGRNPKPKEEQRRTKWVLKGRKELCGCGRGKKYKKCLEPK
jgi:hypothetical protein